MPVPGYLEIRINRAAPSGAFIVSTSTPVVSFGNASAARIATLGLNPSRREFDPVARLATKGSSVEETLTGCNEYFRRKPYKQWFDRLQPSLSVFGASYYDGSACHLDLVQWATDPTWNGLKPLLRKRLIEDDAPFLASQLRTNENIVLLLVNGNGVWEQLCRNLPVEGVRFGGAIDEHSFHRVSLYSGILFGRLKVLAWSANLQSSFGIQKALWTTALPERLRQLHKQRWG